MKKTITFVLIFLLSSPFVYASQIGKINCENIGVINDVNLNTNIIETLNKNDTVSILESKKNYFRIKSPSGKIGWIDSYFVNIQPSKYFVNTCGSNINLRISPTTSSKIVGQIKPNEKLTYLDTFHSWHILEYNGTEVFAASWLGEIVSDGTQNIYLIEDSSNIRTSPSTNSSILSSGEKYSSFSYLGEKYGWFKLNVNNTTAYVAGWLISYNNNYSIKGSIDYKITTDNLRLRSGPSLQDDTKFIMPSGTKVRVLESIDEWDKVLSPEGHVGYSFNKYLKSYLPLSGKVILLDPGHGGKDPGAIGPSGEHEKTVNLSVAFKTKRILENFGASVYMTRSNDTYILNSSRSHMATNLQADILLSIHHNALNDNNYFGMSTYYDTKNNKSGKESKLLAEAIYNSVIEINSIYRDGIYDRNFEVLRSTNVPAALIEIGFISNIWEEKNIQNDSFQDAVSQKISLGILDYFMFKAK
jgi:N-acetylmuramoyl-L-alanine amidase